MPPRNANGTDTTANGQKMFQEKKPARAYRTVPMPATKRFSTNAVGFIISGATPKSAIAARYPDAPPCPTAEYSSAAMKISSVRSIELVIRKLSGYPASPVVHAAAGGAGGGLRFTNHRMLDCVCPSSET